jgi:cellulose biosynthesis protein BcsQ
MRVVAVYNLKGGVGKTTTAVNLSYFSAASGHRTLLWDLDPQGASSFAFRIRSRVAGFSRKSLETGEALAAAIKATDFDRLDLLPADFAYRKLDRLLASFSKPQRVVSDLMEAIGEDYDLVVLDCPPGFSLLTESVFAAADLVLVPTIPTVLSLRALARTIKWADRCDVVPVMATFLSMVDRRKALHRRACEGAALHPDIFLAGMVPYASVVEQMAVRRMPLPAFAPGDPATQAFDAIWTELQSRLQGVEPRRAPAAAESERLLRTLEALTVSLEFVDGTLSGPPAGADARPSSDTLSPSDADARSADGSGDSTQPDVEFVHQFDTADGALRRSGWRLELFEQAGRFRIVAERQHSRTRRTTAQTPRVYAHVDAHWAKQILSGALCPVAGLERRLGEAGATLVAAVRAAAGNRPLRRTHSRQETPQVNEPPSQSSAPPPEAAAALGKWTEANRQA